MILKKVCDVGSVHWTGNKVISWQLIALIEGRDIAKGSLLAKIKGYLAVSVALSDLTSATPSLRPLLILLNRKR